MLKLLHYFTKLCLFNKRNFPKLTSETQVNFVNEAPGTQMVTLFGDLYQLGDNPTHQGQNHFYGNASLIMYT
jgi:hypothetical protein